MNIGVQSYINRCKSSWNTVNDVNSTIRGLENKIIFLRKSRSKELKKAVLLSDKISVRNRYDNDIKYFDHILYSIKLEYYNIIGLL